MPTQNKKDKVFISYAREDLDSARHLYLDLKANGFEPWLDKEDLLPGDEWRPAIVEAIRKCDYFLAMLSSNSVRKTGFVQKELREALSALDQVPEGKKFLIPVRLDECSPSHLRLKDLNWVDLFPSWESGLNRILLALKATDNLKPKSTSKENRPESRVRLTMEFSPEAMRALKELQESSGAASMKDIMMQALTLLSFAVKEVSAGNQLVSIRGDKFVEIVMPILQPRKLKASEFAELAVDSRQ
jgi:hypothetical protein